MASIGVRREEDSTFSDGSMSKLVKEGQGLDFRKFPRTSPEGSEDRRRELACRAEGGAARGPWRVGRGRTEAGWGRRAAREPSLLAGLRAAAQMLFCERARAWPEGRPGHYIAQAEMGAAEGHSPSPCKRLGLGTPQDVLSSTQDICHVIASATLESPYSPSAWSPNCPGQDPRASWLPGGPLLWM